MLKDKRKPTPTDRPPHILNTIMAITLAENLSRPINHPGSIRSIRQ